MVSCRGEGIGPGAAGARLVIVTPTENDVLER
jgi:hypothetical protein